MAHVILFEDSVYRGNHKHVFDNTDGILHGNGEDGEWNLNAGNDHDFNDTGTQSIVVLEGTWEFFEDWKYGGKKLAELGPGRYPYAQYALGTNYSLSSLRPVDSGGSSLSSLLSNIKSEIIKVEEIIERPKHGR